MEEPGGLKRVLAGFRRHRVLIGILIVALVFRVWALPFGLPNLTRPDEQNVSQAAVLHILQSFFTGHPSLNPEFFNYPSLYIYLMTLIYGLYFLIGHLGGFFADGADFVAQYLDNWTSFFILSRSVSVTFGVLTVWAVYLLAMAVCRGREGPAADSRLPGYLAAALMAVTYLHVRDSHFGVTDVTATFWVTVCLWLSVTAYQTHSRKQLTLACIAAGLAASTKYPAGVVALAPMLSFWFQQQEAGATWENLLNRPKVMLPALKVLGLIFGAFLLASPFILLDHTKFLQDFGGQSEAQSSLILKNLGSGWTRHLTFSLWYGLGPLYLIAGLLGLGRAAWKEGHPHWLMLIYAAVFYVLIGNSKIVFVRYILPVIPVLCVYTVWLIRDVVLKIQTRWSQVPGPATAWILLLVIGFSSLSRTFAFDGLLAQTDTRTQAREWLMAALKPNEGVGIGLALSHVDLPFHVDKYFLAPPEEKGAGNNPREFMEVNHATVSDAPNQRHERYITTYSDVAALRKHNIKYVVVAKTPLTLFSTPDFELKKLAAHPELTLVKRFSPYETTADRAPGEMDYDAIDAFYVPFRAFEGLKQPGPELLIYRVK